MKKILFPLLLIFTCLFSCTDESVSPAMSAEQPTSDSRVSASSTVTGLTRFKVAYLNIPTAGLPDGQRFYTDGKLRASTAYNPYGITKVTRNGYQRIKFYVSPKNPLQYLSGTQYPYHYRSEFTRYPWRINHALGTEEWVGFSYLFPTVAEGFVQNQTPVSIYQNHAGSVAGQTSNPPALQLEIAYPGQMKDTPYGGEIMIINNIRGIRYVVPGVRVVAGARLNIILQIVYGVGNTGLFNVWINGKLVTFPGSETVSAGNIGGTVWPPVLSTDVAVGGNSKFGLYHHQMRFSNYVELNATSGHTKMEMYMTDWNDVIRHPGDLDYKSTNAYSAVNTAAYL